MKRVIVLTHMGVKTSAQPTNGESHMVGRQGSKPTAYTFVGNSYGLFF